MNNQPNFGAYLNANKYKDLIKNSRVKNNSRIDNNFVKWNTFYMLYTTDSKIISLCFFYNLNLHDTDLNITY